MLVTILLLCFCLLLSSIDCSAPSCGTTCSSGWHKISMSLKLTEADTGGGPTSEIFNWSLDDKQNGYSGTLGYHHDPFGSGFYYCSTDGIFCISDRVNDANGGKFGYTLYYRNQCSNYWAETDYLGWTSIGTSTGTGQYKWQMDSTPVDSFC